MDLFSKGETPMSEPLILVVEDETDIRDLITLTLQFNGFQIVQAVDGEEAIEKASEIEPDLILMDIRMPRMTGYQACQILKNQTSTKDIPIVFLSAKGQDAEINTGLALGAADYLLKPFDPGSLPRRLREILDQHGKSR